MKRQEQFTSFIVALAVLSLATVPAEANLSMGVYPARSGGDPAGGLTSNLDVLNTAGEQQFRFEALSDPIIGNSWDALFYVHAPSSFTHLGMVVSAGGALQGAPSMFGFADLGGPLGGWSQFFGPGSGGTGSTALSFGTATNDLFWTGHFEGFNPGEQAFSMTLFSFNNIGEDVWDGAVADWDGSSWTVSGVPDLSVWEAFQATVTAGVIESVPVPSAALLGLFGFGLVGSLRKRLV